MHSDEQKVNNKLVLLFKEEAADHLKTINDGLFALEKSPDSNEEKEIIQEIFRSAHSLKGASRAINFIEIEGLCSILEEVLDNLRSGKVKLTSHFLETLFEATDTLESIIQHDNENHAINDSPLHSTKNLITKLDNLITVDNSEKESVPEPLKSDNNGKNEKEKQKESSITSSEIKISEVKEPASHDTIRVSARKIDKLLHHVEEMLMIKLSSEQKVKDLELLQYLLSDWNKNSIHQKLESSFQEICLQMRSAALKDDSAFNTFIGNINKYFDGKKGLFTEISEKLDMIKHLCEKDHRMVCSLVDTVIEDTKEILMQPFSTILDGLPKMTREIANFLKKNVVMEIVGDDIEVDRRILEKLKDPMIHLVRNCIDHGIEESEERKQLDKKDCGTIRVETKQVGGNTFEVVISDDGRGIDFSKVLEQGLKDGLISQEDCLDRSEDQLVKLLFQSGFSTSSIVTDISGRGVGLNVLGENVEKLGGVVKVKSQSGLGTQFIITMPLTLATFRGIHIRVSGQDFIIPTHNVVKVLRVSLNQLKTVESCQTIKIENDTYSFIDLSQILGLPKPTKEDKDELKPALLIKASDIQIALGIDEIYAEQEVFVKGLGTQLLRVKNIAATTIMEWGKVIPILDPFDLVKTSVNKTYLTSKIPLMDDIEEIEQKTILIVEDSITSRMLLKNILETSDYHVISAVDGVEGFDKLQNECVDLVLSDVEMPRMNGFKLTEKIRSTEKFKEIPVILCTSRGSREDREYGIEVGANAYLDKSNFKQKNLLEIVDQLIGRQS